MNVIYEIKQQVLSCESCSLWVIHRPCYYPHKTMSHVKIQALQTYIMAAPHSFYCFLVTW